MKVICSIIISILLICLMLAATFGADAGKPTIPKGWKVYKGAMFNIAYPPHFTVHPSQKAAAGSPVYDSALFISPDKHVEFYVFSPQWKGEPHDIQLNPKTEKLVSSRSQLTKKTHGYNIRINWQTIQARDKSYTRAIMDHFEGSGAVLKDDEITLRWTFGVKYTSQQAYAKYQDAYTTFKNSLEQFAD